MFTLKIAPPYYLISSREHCYACKRFSPVVAIGVAHFAEVDDEDTPEEIENELSNSSGVIALTNVVEIPTELLAEVHKHHQKYEKRSSRMAEHSYYMNLCVHCGAHFGDYFLFSEPGHAFFPDSASGNGSMTYLELPLKSNYQVNAGYSSGGFSELMEPSE